MVYLHRKDTCTIWGVSLQHSPIGSALHLELQASCVQSLRPAGAKIALCFLHLFACWFVCVSVLITCAIMTSRTLFACDFASVYFTAATIQCVGWRGLRIVHLPPASSSQHGEWFYLLCSIPHCRWVVSPVVYHEPVLIMCIPRYQFKWPRNRGNADVGWPRVETLERVTHDAYRAANWLRMSALNGWECLKAQLFFI